MVGVYMNKIWRILLVFLACSANCFALEKTEKQISGIYSNLYFNQDGGDLLGMELLIVPSKSREPYTVFLQISEGGFPYTAKIPLHVNGNIIEFTLPDEEPYPNFHFVGEIKGKIITIKWPNGETSKLSNRKSYWQ